MWVQYYDFEKNSVSTGFIFIFIFFCFLLLGTFTFYSGLSDGYENKKQQEDIIGKSNSVSQAVGGLFIILFSVLMLLLIGINYTFNDSSLEKLEKKIKVIEGCIENFKAGKGRIEESFKVANINFEYKEIHTNRGYNKIRSQGGIIDEGKLVRIHYYKGEILRLWVWEEKKE